MRINNLKWIGLLGVLLVTLSSCSGGNASQTPPTTRLATQTPWLIYVPVTVTPDPATITPLPTAVIAAAEPTKGTATRTPTKAPAVIAKTPTKAATVAPAAPTATAQVACNLGSVSKLIFPGDGALRRTKTSGFSPDTFDFQWTPFTPGEADPLAGYRIEIQSKRGSQIVNGDVVDVQHNWFVTNGQHYNYDSRRVQNLASPAGGDSVTVLWTVTVIKTTGSYDNVAGKSTGTVTKCGPAPAPLSINLQVCGLEGC